MSPFEAAARGMVIGALACFIVIGCATPPCPTQLEVGGHHSRGRIQSSGPENGADRYTESGGHATLTFDLGTHHDDCGVYNGGHVEEFDDETE